MKRLLSAIWRILSVLLSLAVLGALVYGLFLLVSNALDILVELETTIIAAFVASTTAVFGYWYTQRQTKSREISEAHRIEKVKLYGGFMDLLGKYLKPGMKGKSKSIDPRNPPKEILDMFYEFSSNLIVWGSPGMIKAFSEFRRSASRPDENTNPLINLDNVLRAIRKDLGNRNIGIRRGDLIKIFLTDPEELDKK